MKAINIKTEYLTDPIGIDMMRPRIFWNCEGGTYQTAYRIIAKNAGGLLLWDSGKVASSRMAGIEYGGEALRSRDEIIYTVTLWDENDNEGPLSDPATFELGLVNEDDFKASFITGDYRPAKGKRYPVDHFRKKFVCEKNVKKARLYVTACGLYEAFINGERCGEFVLAPGYTDYNRRIQYQTIDVTKLVRRGNNEITAMLADGWYRGSIGAWGLTYQYGLETKLYAQLEVTFEDGSVRTIRSDATWEWSNDGPIRFADNKDGEIVDANLEPSYSGKARVTNHKVQPTASNNVPVLEHERFSAALITTPSGKKVLDFGQNMAGYIEFHIKARKGQRMLLRFGELLGTDGEFTQKNIQCSNKHKTTPLQQIDYTCRGGMNDYKTTFAIFGFQYVEVTGDIDPNPEDFTAIAVYSDMKETGFFESSNELLNKFVHATKWSTKSNSCEIPTDCPTRERHGWTGDAQIFFESASYLFDYAAFAEKYLKDVYDIQEKNGCLPQIAPYGGVDSYMKTMNGSVGWADVGVLIPYRFYKKYGDRRILVDYYERMKKYAQFMIGRCGKNALISDRIAVSKENRKYFVNAGQSYGEWAEPNDVRAFAVSDFIKPHPEVSTAYTAFIMDVMCDVAVLLGRNEDLALYREYSEGCRRAYRELVTNEKFTLDTDRQACLVRPLRFGLLNDEQTAFAKKRLIKALENYGWRLGTGFLSTPLILDVLAEYDVAAAYRLLENEEIPGWLSMPKNGATTIWEGWEGPKSQGGIASLNHYSKGALCEWLFGRMCGIKPCGENEFSIMPLPGGSFTFARAEYESVYGKVVSGWKKTPEGYSYEICVPANTTAHVSLPDGRKLDLSVGEYSL